MVKKQKGKKSVKVFNLFNFNLNFTKIHRFHQPRFGSKLTCVHNPSCGGNNLTTPSMNSISVQSNIINVEPTCPHVFIAQNTLMKNKQKKCKQKLIITWISTRYTGSINLGSAVKADAYNTRLAVGIIWPPPLWIASVCRVTS